MFKQAQAHRQRDKWLAKGPVVGKGTWLADTQSGGWQKHVQEGFHRHRGLADEAGFL